MNYLMPVKPARNWLLPQETNKMRMASPLMAKLDELEAQMAALEKSKTVRQVVSERANDQSRWDNSEGVNADASELATTPPGDEPDQPKQRRHKFETMVNNVAQRDGVTKAVAAARARKEYPELFEDFQNSGGVAKSFSELIADEIRKGCSDVVAHQRVAYEFPQAARESIAKSESGVSEFMDALAK